MKNILLLTSLLVVSFSAKADVIKCGFTEPFVTVTYNTATQRLTEKNDSEQKTKLYRNVEFYILAAGKFELRSAKGALLMTLDLTGNGSDGMSDTTYPYEAKYMKLNNGANSGVGGCSSNLLPIKTAR